MSSNIAVVRLREALAAVPLARPAVRLGRHCLRKWRVFRGRIRTEQQLRTAWRWFDTLWKSPPSPALVCGRPSNEALPVVMCLWNRPHRLDQLLRMLDAQQLSRPLRLVLWNNSAADHERYEQAVSAFRRQGAIASIELIRSPFNIRGMGRFIAMRGLLNSGFAGPFVMLDDDQDIPVDFCSSLLAEFAPQSIAGCWAWQAQPGEYWRRVRPGPGDPANYVGTGGCICDSALVADREFFTELPWEGLFLEDVWMCRFALSRGWRVIRSCAQADFGHDDDNQYHDLTAHKVAFWRTLQQRFPLPD